MKVGIPRALLYYFYEDLWLEFFKNLNIETIVSPESNKQIVKNGISNSIDEGCYSSKIFIGHVEYLLDKCDLIFVPRIECTGIREEYCTRIFGVYDLTKNTFPEAKLLHADINYLFRKREADAFREIGTALGKTPEETMAAYTAALEKSTANREAAIYKQAELLNSNGTKVLIVSHPYNSFDAVIGKSILRFFENNHIKVAFANLVNTKDARAKAKEIYGNRIYWKINLELLGGVEIYKEFVDGIVFISTFPCGPDSIINELIIRNIKDMPVLSLMIDELDATAGLITRLESFTDILAAKKRSAM